MSSKSPLKTRLQSARKKLDAILDDLKKYHSAVRPYLTTEDLINAESELGRLIFGKIPAGHRREFFEHKKNVWIWHESWSEADQEKSITVRYEVRPTGVFKRPAGGSYMKIEGAELENFRRALHEYLRIVKEKLY